jgi:DNA polymerase III subunit epsilon
LIYIVHRFFWIEYKNEMYTIIDIETTGLSPDKDKITEIAIYAFDGHEIVDEFISLVNPERTIPYFITRLTGITDRMVENAPKFYEIAKKIIEITDKRIFVAHNVDFDYGFIKAEFAALGYEFKRNKLCTVKLSRKFFPGKKSYSLGKLTDELGIKIDGRHRAAGDAYATVQLFNLLLRTDAQSKPLIDEMIFHSYKGLNPMFKKSILDEIPEKTGVYYFYDETDNLIYVGKSINIHSRILQHLNNNTTKKAIEMKNRVVNISYEITGSELIALLLESNEIKKSLPLYNRSQRRTSFHFGIYTFTNDNAYINFEIRPNSGNEIPLTSFSNITGAKKFLEQMVMRFELCQKLCGLYKSTGSCFHFGIKECRGACIGNENNESYNERAKKAIESLEYKHNDFLIIDKGRDYNEKSVVLVNKGTYRGFGYINPEFIGNNKDILIDCIKNYSDNRDIQIIIKGYMDRNSDLTIIPLNEDNL